MQFIRPSTYKLGSTIVAALLCSACQTTTANGISEKLYDFDHQVHYEQVTYTGHHYLLKVKSDSYQHFTRQSVFLLRHSKRLCQGLIPQMTISSGIQEFDKLPLTPRPYQNDLIAEVRCVTETKPYTNPLN
ncbi:hypothetical protein ACSLBF_00600 [Pseudoalteromonas sp. T1lg65]|uniref:hypothetical protein n=1 Tax=Pseudoalteromonas sp. T1lg65 TaxID=2077101 RepID=UPI003F793194